MISISSRKHSKTHVCNGICDCVRQDVTFDETNVRDVVTPKVEFDDLLA